MYYVSASWVLLAFPRGLAEASHKAPLGPPSMHAHCLAGAGSPFASSAPSGTRFVQPACKPSLLPCWQAFCLLLAQVLKYGAMSANIVTEEPIDMVLHESYPNRLVSALLPAVVRVVLLISALTWCCTSRTPTGAAAAAALPQPV